MGSRSLNVAMFTETFLPHANGVTTSIVNARRGLFGRGHQVDVYAGGSDTVETDSVHYYGGKVFPLYPDFPLALYTNKASRRSHRALKKQGADLVHIHAPGPMGLRGYAAAKRKKVPFLVTYHTFYEPLVRYAPLGLKTLYKLGSSAIDRVLNRACSILIAPTHHTKRELLKRHPKLERKIRVVPTGIDLERFRPGIDASAARASWGFGSDARIILYLGRLSYEKRVDLLLRAFARLHAARPELRLVLAGTGPATADYHALADELGILDETRFAGHVPDGLVPAYYNAADVFASASEFETQGLTVIEALACGRPCAVAAAGGFLDIVKDGENGYLFPGGSVDGAVHALELALAAPPTLRNRARSSALPYGIDHCVMLLERAYQEALDGHEAAA